MDTSFALRCSHASNIDVVVELRSLTIRFEFLCRGARSRPKKEEAELKVYEKLTRSFRPPQTTSPQATSDYLFKIVLPYSNTVETEDNEFECMDGSLCGNATDGNCCNAAGGRARCPRDSARTFCVRVILFRTLKKETLDSFGSEQSEDCS